MLDSNLKPWLIEINAPPGLGWSFEEHKKYKVRVINSTLELILKVHETLDYKET